jgi:hypothetical protein
MSARRWRNVTAALEHRLDQIQTPACLVPIAIIKLGKVRRGNRWVRRHDHLQARDRQPLKITGLSISPTTVSKLITCMIVNRRSP